MIWEKKRPKGLGKPKPFNKKSKAYKSAKAKATRKFGMKKRDKTGGPRRIMPADLR